jgi:hypothetical protein
MLGLVLHLVHFSLMHAIYAHWNNLSTGVEIFSSVCWFCSRQNPLDLYLIGLSIVISVSKKPNGGPIDPNNKWYQELIPSNHIMMTKTTQ